MRIGGRNANLPVLAGPQEIARVGENGRHLDGPRFDVDLAVGESKGALVGVDAPVGEDEFRSQLFGLLLPIASGLDVLLFAHLDVDLDRVDRRDRRQLFRGPRSDEVSDLRLGKAGDAVHGGSDPGEPQIELGLVDGGLGGEYRRAGRLLRADGVVEVLLADGVLFGKGLDPCQVCLGRRPAGLLGLELALSLIQGRLEGARVDLEEDLPCLHEVAFPVVLLDEVSLDLGPYGGVHHSVEGPDPLPVDGHVLLDDRHHLHGGCRRGLLGTFRATHRNEEQQDDDRKVRVEPENNPRIRRTTP